MEDRAKTMKKIGRGMSLLMGVTLSFFLSLTGLLSAGKFSVPALIVNFLVSLAISLVIGLLIPMGKVNAAVAKRLELRPGERMTRYIECLVSDLIYTPIMTLCMIIIAYKQATSQGARILFVPMFIKGLVISMIVGYVLIYIFMPLYLGMLMKKYGAQPPEDDREGRPFE